MNDRQLSDSPGPPPILIPVALVILLVNEAFAASLVGSGSEPTLALKRQLISGPLSILGICLVGNRLGMSPIGQLGLTGRQLLRQGGWGIALGLVLSPTLLGVSYLARSIFPPSEVHPAFQVLFQKLELWGPVKVCLVAVLVAPILEEILFRSVFLLGIASVLGKGWGVAISSLLFGLAHLQTWPDPIPLVFMGGILAIAFLRTGTLWVPILAHAMFNGVMLTLFLLDPTPVPPSTDADALVSPSQSDLGKEGLRRYGAAASLDPVRYESPSSVVARIGREESLSPFSKADP
ncbi:CPBP family intramembrane metalloprotease [bacterium]|nr:CPBP family intramembrane metalloprotease [bacterium]